MPNNHCFQVQLDPQGQTTWLQPSERTVGTAQVGQYCTAMLCSSLILSAHDLPLWKLATLQVKQNGILQHFVTIFGQCCSRALYAAPCLSTSFRISKIALNPLVLWMPPLLIRSWSFSGSFDLDMKKASSADMNAEGLIWVVEGQQIQSYKLGSCRSKY